MGIGKEFGSGCVDIVERGRRHGAEVIKVTIEGIFEEEVFSFSYTPKEEGYDEKDQEGTRSGSS